jgi:hypothetical protein
MASSQALILFATEGLHIPRSFLFVWLVGWFWFLWLTGGLNSGPRLQSKHSVASTYWFNQVQINSTQETLISEGRSSFKHIHRALSCGSLGLSLLPWPAGLPRPSPALAHLAPPSQPMRVVKLRPRGSSGPPAVQVQFRGSPATPSGHREKGHAHKWRLPPRQGLGIDSAGMVSCRRGE